MRELLQRLSLTRVLGMEAEGNEEPKAKRPCLEDEKQSDLEENGGATVKKEVRSISILIITAGSISYYCIYCRVGQDLPNAESVYY